MPSLQSEPPFAVGPDLALPPAIFEREATVKSLDHELRRLVAGEMVLDLVLGVALESMRSKNAYESLGSARWKDYCREHLGMSEPAARALAWRAVMLRRRPVLLSAWLQGRLRSCHLDHLLRRLPDTGDLDESWVAVAERLSLRGLRKLLARPETVPATGAKTSGVLQGEPERVLAWMSQNLDGAAAVEPPPEPTDGEWRVYRPSADLYARLLEAQELCHRVAGEEQSPTRVFEAFHAEYLAGAPLPGAGEIPPPPAEREPAMVEDLEFLDRAFGVLEVSAGDVRVSEEFLGTLPEPPHERQGYVRRVLQVRQRLDFYAGRLLRRLHEQDGPRKLGFPGLAAYGEARLGLGASAVFQAVRRDAHIEFRGLGNAVSEGRLTLSQVDLLLPLLDGGQVEAWVNFAHGHTVRHLARVVEALHLLRLQDYAAWEERGGLPLQQGESVEDIHRLIRESRQRRNQEMHEEREAALSEGRLPTEVGGFLALRLAMSEQEAAGGGRLPKARWTLANLPESVRRVSLDSLPEEHRAWIERLLPGRLMGLRTFLLEELPAPAYAELEETVRWMRELPEARLRELAGLRAAREAGGAGGVEVRVWLPRDILEVVRRAEEAACLEAGRPLTAEEILEKVIEDFLATWGGAARRTRRPRRTFLERRGCRCEVPGCTCRANLHDHHVKPRARGGGNEECNRVLACARHHLGHIHQGRMRTTGRAPDVVWEVGIEGGRPWQVFVGDRRVAGAGILA